MQPDSVDWPVEDEWGPGPSILASETLVRLRCVIDTTPLIVEHWFYRGASSPSRRIIDDGDELEAYLRDQTQPGDSIWIWRFDQLCREDNPFTHAKVPDAHGSVPKRGAY